MKNKKGFTLIELLAVIVILAVIVLIGSVSVYQITRNAKKAAFQDEVKEIYKSAKDKYVESDTDKLFETGSLDLKNADELEYSLLFNDDGGLVCFEINNDEYIYRYRNDGTYITNIDQVAKDVDSITEYDHNVISDCTLADELDTTKKSTILAQGDWWKFTDAQVQKSDITNIIIENRYSNPITSNTIKYTIDFAVEGGITVYVDKTSKNVAHIVNNTNRSYKNAFSVQADASGMFKDFPNLKQIDGLKLLDMSNVTKIDEMFANCPNLSQVRGIDNWDTSKVTSAKKAFYNTKISTVSLSKWNTSSLKDISGMFQETASKQIDLGGWNVTNVTNFSNMFYKSKAETIILSGWNTKGTASYGNMFSECSELQTILTSKNFKVNSYNVDMFTNDTKILGENNTPYINGKSTYAKIDKEGQQGYFTENSEDGLVTAKLYNSGSVSNENTSLTESGTIPAEWNYYDGVRLLEIDLSYMNSVQENTLEITVPTGMYIKENSWTTGDSRIKSVVFAKNTNQGTGTYSNNFTGTLKYTFKSGTTSIKIQCLVMFDETIWDKHKYKDFDIANNIYMTKEPPVTVDYNSGSSVKKIANIKSAIGVGRGDDGYSLYVNRRASNVYVGDSTKLLLSNFLLSSDQSKVPEFYKSIKYTTYATSTNASGSTIYADIEASTMPSHLGTPESNTNSGGTYTATWSNKWKSSDFDFPLLKYKLDSSKGFVEGKYLRLYVEVELTSYSGQVTKKSNYVDYKIKSKNLDISDLSVSGGNHTSPYDTYYGTSGLIDVLGYTTIGNYGYSDFTNVAIKYEFDIDRASTGKITQRTYAVNLPAENGQTIEIKATMINDAGDTVDVTKNEESKSTTNGVYVNAENFKPGYYFKEISYTLSKISGTKGGTTNWLYHSQGAQSQDSGGVFMGTISNTGSSSRTRLTVTAQGFTKKEKIVYSSGTSSFSLSGTIYQIKTGDGKKEYKAGDNIELDVQIMAVSYPYTYTQAFSKPELYIALPEGMKIEYILLNNDINAVKSEAVPVTTLIKTIDIKGKIHNVYKISFKSDVWFGYVHALPTYKTSINPAKWIKLNISTDPGMDYTSMNLRDNIYFKDGNGHISIGGAWAKSITNDKYDVDGDGSTSDYFGVIDATDQELIIREVTE